MPTHSPEGQVSPRTRMAYLIVLASSVLVAGASVWGMIDPPVDLPVKFWAAVVIGGCAADVGTVVELELRRRAA